MEKTLEDRGIRAKRACGECEDVTTWEKQVWVSVHGANAKTKYHTNSDCYQLPDDHRQKSLHKIQSTFDVCRFCSGEAAKPESDYSYYMAAKEAAQE